MHHNYYQSSKKLLQRAEGVIPLGCQTFSKSKISYPEDAPLYLDSGSGPYVYDIDGNEYIDCVAGLLPVILGYCDDDVDSAIKDQLNKGISFSLGTKLEIEVAERLVQFIPCAEMVRFGKNGSDVTNAAIRLARLHTGRDYIISSGYHGWADSFVAGDGLRGGGVPTGVAKYTYHLTHGDIKNAVEWIESKQFACIIVEPEGDIEFLARIRSACDKTGTILIFDEVITGFRWALGGAQQFYGITPDLACFGKAMGNGMPINAVVGKREIMQRMVPPGNIFYSGTFQGETLSLAAAQATMAKIERLGVIPLWVLGDKIYMALKDQSFLKPKNGPIVRVSFNDLETRTLYQQAMIDRGILFNGTSFNIMFTHSKVIDRIVDIINYVNKYVQDAIDSDTVKNKIRGRVIESASKIREEYW